VVVARIAEIISVRITPVSINGTSDPFLTIPHLPISTGKESNLHFSDLEQGWLKEFCNVVSFHLSTFSTAALFSKGQYPAH
jgi:hypothetical protein